MMLCNKTSRYHVAATAIRAGAKHNPAVAVDSHEMAMFMMHMAAKDREYIYQNGEGQLHAIMRPSIDFVLTIIFRSKGDFRYSQIFLRRCLGFSMNKPVKHAAIYSK